MPVNGVPRAKEQPAVGSAGPDCLAKRAGLLGEENDAELADGEVELVVAEGHVQRVGLLP
jgi:hypothetical protein